MRTASSLILLMGLCEHVGSVSERTLLIRRDRRVVLSIFPSEGSASLEDTRTQEWRAVNDASRKLQHRLLKSSAGRRTFDMQGVQAGLSSG